MSYTAQQLHWAKVIIAAAKAHPGLVGDQHQRAADIALATALVESGLRNYANGNNPASMRIVHDAVGWDHGSVGVFQAQVGGAPNSTADWGTTAQCMDVTYATHNFLNHLQRLDWLHMTNGGAAQRVQGSAFPDRYAQVDAQAIALRKSLWSATPAPAPKPAAPAHGQVGTWTVRDGDTLTSIAHRYPQAWITAASIARLNHLADPDKIYVGQHLKIG